MLHALNDMASSKNTEATMLATKHFLNYAACNPKAEIMYRGSDMVLQADSDAAYLVCPVARSRAAGFHFLGDKGGKQFNGPVLVLAKIIKNVMSSAAEAELVALFMNAQEMVPMRQCLEEMGHKQPATPIKTDNSTAVGVLNGTMKQKRSKAMDMRIYWIKDRVQQKQFAVTWESGKSNKGDYPSKHHSGAHHRQVRPVYLNVDGASPRTVQGCIEILNSSHGIKGTGKKRALNMMRNRCAMKKKRCAYRVTWKERVAVFGEEDTVLSKRNAAIPINC